MGYRSITSADGTRLRSWSNEGRGVPVLVSNGLGTPHDAWPTINRQTETYRVVTWDHRGLGGSDRPADESRITIPDHTDDLFAVIASGAVKIQIHQRFKLADAREAHEALHSRNTTGATILTL